MLGYSRHRQLTFPCLVIVDDLGFTAMDRAAAEHLFRFVAAAYEKSRLIVSTNVEFQRWPRFLPNETVATAILERLQHHCHVIRLAASSSGYTKRGGSSPRPETAETARRRTTKKSRHPLRGPQDASTRPDPSSPPPRNTAREVVP